MEEDDELSSIFYDAVENVNGNSEEHYAIRQREKKKLPTTTPRKRKDSRKGSINEVVLLLDKGILEDKHSFYADKEPVLTGVKDNQSGEELITILYLETLRIYNELKKHFITSGVYVGKTTKMRFAERFSMHRKKAKSEECIVMVLLAEFNHIPLTYKNNYFGDSETLALAYERKLLCTIQQKNEVPLLKEQENGGGGKMSSEVDVGCVYVLYAIKQKSEYYNTIKV